MDNFITFISLQEQHFSLLLQWLELPHVKAWWDREIVWNMDLIKEKYIPYVQGYKIVDGKKKPLHAYIICVDHKAIGYIQLYNAKDFPREDGITLDDLPSSVATFDVYIGDSEYIGKGYATKIIQQFLAEYVDPYYKACVIDPDTANRQAVRAYQKAGFEIIQTIKQDTATCMIRIKKQ